MTAYIARRLVSLVPVLVGITIFAFVLLRLTGDPVALMLPPMTPPAAIEQFRKEFGLDQPLHIQYLRFVGGVLHGDLGTSIRYKESVLTLFLERLPATLELALSALLLTIVIGIPLGVVAAVKQNSRIDNFIRVALLFGQAIPNFYLGLLLILLVAVEWRLVPTGGRGTWQQALLPVIVLSAYSVSLVARFTRGAVLDVLRADYVRTARAKGLNELLVLGRHVLKNAMIPVITVIGLQVGNLFSGAVVTETVFAWPGIGRLMVDSITTRDFPIVQATVMITALMFVMANLLVDLAYGLLDPRIRYG